MIIPVYQLVSRGWLVLAAAVLLATLLALVIGRRRAGETQIALITILGVATAFYTAVIYASGPEVVNRAHASGLFVIGTLLPWSIISVLPDPTRKWISLAALAGVLVLSVHSLYLINLPMAKHADLKHIAEFIEANEEPIQPILVYPGKMALPFSYHYGGENPVVSIPRPSNLDSDHLHVDVLQSVDEVAQAVDRVPGEHERMWVISTMRPDLDEYLGVKYNSGLLLEYLQSNYWTIMTRPYMGSQLIYLRKKR
jgi:hypothetical protein